MTLEVFNIPCYWVLTLQINVGFNICNRFVISLVLLEMIRFCPEMPKEIFNRCIVNTFSNPRHGYRQPHLPDNIPQRSISANIKMYKRACEQFLDSSFKAIYQTINKLIVTMLLNKQFDVCWLT